MVLADVDVELELEVELVDMFFEALVASFCLEGITLTSFTCSVSCKASFKQ
ncbi:hypothetical protein ACHBHL_10400 [Streptococcus sp. A27]|uniref:hypothetical protein n=1 Tax=unclassified Streptococcus TaxID=2608887 RepID=UPI00374D923A